MRVRLIAVFGSAAIQRFSILFMTVLAARLIGATEYGKFALVYAASTGFAAFIGDALGATVNKYALDTPHASPAAAPEAAAAALSFAVAAAFVLGCAMVALAPWLAPDGGGTDLLNCMRLAGVIAFCLLINIVMSAILNTFHHNVAAALAALTASVLSVGLGLGGALLGGAFGMCAGFACGCVIASVVYLTLLQRLQPFPFVRIGRARQFLVSAPMRHFTLPTLATMALGGPVHLICLGFLATDDNGLRNVAVFTVLFQWYSIMTFVPGAMMNFTIPWLARSRAAGQDAGRRAAGKVVLANLALSALMFAILVAAREPILALYGPDFRDEGALLALVGGCGLLACLIAVMNQISWAAGRSWSNLLTAAVYAGGYVTASFTLIKLSHLGVAGLGGAILIASVLQCLIQIRFFFLHSRNVS